MASWTSQWVCRMACAAVVSVGQKGSTLREDVKTYSHTVIRRRYIDMREAVYLFTMCKDNNSGLMHQISMDEFS